MNENEILNSLMNAIKGLVDMDNNLLTDEVTKEVLKNTDEQFNPVMVQQSISQIVQNFEEQGLTKAEARTAMDALADVLKDMIYGENEFIGNKKVIVDTIANKMFSIFDEAVAKYHSYSIKLPMTVDKGAKVPTYAHETDAAADLYAMEDQVIVAHTYGNKIGTGVKIQLPEGQLAMILPRSSMGTKTPLRLSNSVGLIDSGYRGELGVLYDNTSDMDYKISAGDRIAQLLVMPSHRFQAEVVDSLEDSDRGETGFGDSGK